MQWIVIQNLSFLQPHWRRLPFLRCNIAGWNYDDKFKIHEDLGKVFVHVTPQGSELFVADASAMDRILSRKKEFIKPIGMLGEIEYLHIYAPIIKLTSTRISRPIWKELSFGKSIPFM